MKITEAVLQRAPEADPLTIKSYEEAVVSRLCLRLKRDDLPDSFEPIAADAVLKMHRRAYFEGIASEGTDGISTTFVNDILSEYEPEIKAFLDREAMLNGRGTVYFL